MALGISTLTYLLTYLPMMAIMEEIRKYCEGDEKFVYRQSETCWSEGRVS